MIRYALKCSRGHQFESWFQTAGAYEKLAAAGLLSCAVCSDGKVEKDIMAPRVRTGRGKDSGAVAKMRETSAKGRDPGASQVSGDSKTGSVSENSGPARDSAADSLVEGPVGKVERALGRLRAHVEATSEDVGREFAREARAMHDGDKPERSIRGEARADEARALIEDGIPILPLPFVSGRKKN